MRKIDFHVHINSQIPIEESVRYFKDMMDRFGYEGIGIMSLLNSSHGVGDYGCNERAVKIKEALPGSYAFAYLDHRRDLVEQTKEYMKQGFDGIKIIEGKPNQYKINGFGLDTESFDRFFAYAESAGIPIMLHNNDPAQNWDITKADARANEKGWVYDETFPSQHWFFEALETVLEKHPDLKVALAHMGFYSDNLEKAAYLLDRCPNLRLDITPALIIYSQLSKQPDAGDFFRKYSSRLIYGTDADNNLTGFARDYNDKKVRVITAFLEGDSPCAVDGMDLNPIHLERSILEKIYALNALEFMKK